MALYIKGLSLPEKEQEGKLYILTSDGNLIDMQFNEYSVVEIKEPHGTLIDKDLLERNISHSVVFSGRDNSEVTGARKIVNQIYKADEVVSSCLIGEHDDA